MLLVPALRAAKLVNIVNLLWNFWVEKIFLLKSLNFLLFLISDYYISIFFQVFPLLSLFPWDVKVSSALLGKALVKVITLHVQHCKNSIYLHKVSDSFTAI